MIASSTTTGTKPRLVLLIDDLPLANGRHAFERLQNCLMLLVKSTQMPTVVLITDYVVADSSDQTARTMEDLQSSLERAGALKVYFIVLFEVLIKLYTFGFFNYSRYVFTGGF